jgi:hypothetical protein
MTGSRAAASHNDGRFLGWNGDSLMRVFLIGGLLTLATALPAAAQSLAAIKLEPPTVNAGEPVKITVKADVDLKVVIVNRAKETVLQVKKGKTLNVTA